MRLFLLLSVIATSLSSSTLVGKRAVGVKGQLLCGSQPASNVRVRLFRVKQSKKDDLNQILEEKATDLSGKFYIEGNTNGFPLNETDLSPIVSFYHTCDEDATKLKKNGYRKFNYNIPEEYVNLGAKPKKVYDIGILNIQLQFPGEKHDKNFVIRDTKA